MTEAHLTEEDLVLHYYGELSDAEEASAAAHLDGCNRCRTDYTRLQRVLGAVDDTAVTPALPDGFERTVWARLEPSLRRESRGWTSWLPFLQPGAAFRLAPYIAVAAIVVLVAGAFWAGRRTSPAPVVAPGGSTAASAEQIRERILLVDLGQHLERSQMVLVELVSSEDDMGVDVDAERSRATELVADNRLYRQAAALSGDAALADLLDEIDRVLTDVAASPARASAGDLADVRRRIESRDLLFKVRVVSSAVRERQRELQLRAGPRS